MTEEELAQAILDFPFLLDVFVGATIPPSLDFFEEECDAYKELLTRENGKNALMEKLKSLSQDDSVEIEFKADALRILLLYTEVWKEQLTEEDVSYLKEDMSWQVEE